MEPYLSEIRLMSFTFAPRGWAVCAGQLLPINQNQGLFSLLGTTYGGDGRVNFALPDLRARALMHEGSDYPLGARAGSDTVTLTAAQLPQHTHGVGTGAGQADSTQAGGGFLATAADAYVRPAGESLVALAGGSVAAVGGNQPHENRQPFLTLNYCIALQGVFPTPN